MKSLYFLSQRKRIISLALLSIMLSDIMIPNIAFALTAGPTSPEASSFEPIDTTDIVNPLTGSMTYNLPLIEVPGPEGGYPLSLSYHAGVSPNLEASWVGLGWTLNPGAINRNVSGFPDDYNEVNLLRRDYWAGGTRREFGINIGFGGVVNAGLTFSSDTYQGFGVGVSAGIGYKDGYFNAFAGASASTYGNASIGGLVGANIGVASASINTGYDISSNSLYGYGDLTLGNELMGISLTTNSNKPTFKSAGVSTNIGNPSAGKISTNSSFFGFFVPLPNGMSLSAFWKKTRYWSDEISTITTNGVLNLPYKNIPNHTYFSNRTGDVYRLMDFPNKSVLDNEEEYQYQGGTYADYDNYTVLAQGIGGSMKPYLFKRSLYTQNYTPANQQKDIIALAHSISNDYENGVGFRFENDFSNAYRQQLSNITLTNNASAPGNFPFSSKMNTNSMNGNILPGSKHIAHYTNDEIQSGAAKANGFIDISANTVIGFQRLSDGTGLNNTRGGKQIGGYSVTNASGVTYHYALPAYTRNEFTYTQNKDGSKFTYTERKEPYAYTWHLTAVTGPDYVDRNANGLADAGDWGYWVAFDYGKWSNSYNWRNPGIGFNEDLENGYSNYSKGTKEVYYLNSIRTRSHIALFEKEIRLDGKGAATANTNNYQHEGGFDEYSAQSLRLNKIYLLNISDAGLLNTSIGVHDGPRTFDMKDNVFDNKDVEALGRSTFEQKSLKVIDFDHSYSLVKNTANSYPLTNISEKHGKLTLDKIGFRGKGGISLIPKTVFEYEEPSVYKNVMFSNSTKFTAVGSSPFKVGDMLETSSGDYCGVIISEDVSNGGEVPSTTYSIINGNFSPSGLTGVQVRKTKNPPFNKDAYDNWGYYKADVNTNLLSTYPDLARMPTSVSGKAADAWCLRRIKSPLGADVSIEYEGAVYKDNVLKNIQSAIFNDCNVVDLNTLEFKMLYGKEYFQGPDAIFKPGDKLELTYLDYTYEDDIGYRYYSTANSTTNNIAFTFDKVVNNSVYVKFPLGTFYHRNNGVSAYGKKPIAGNIRLRNPEKNYGGGIRTKSIAIIKKDGQKNVTTYDYLSSGVTSYAPNNLEIDAVGSYPDHIKNAYRKELYKDMDYLLSISREVPPPAVMYGSVNVSTDVVQANGDKRHLGKIYYYYRTFNRKMVDRITLQQQDSPSQNTFAHNKTIKNYTANIGDLLRVIKYDEQGNKLEDLRNTYIYDELANLSGNSFYSAYDSKLEKFNYQGTIIERFGDYRSFRWNQGSTTNWRYTMVMSAIERYPSILLKTEIQNPSLGTRNISENLVYDKFSGGVTEQLNTDVYGNRYIEENIPAYTKYAEMGIKVNSPHNKNMLTQLAGTITHKVDANNNKTGVLAASATIWGNSVAVLDQNENVILQNNLNNGNVWRPMAQFTYQPSFVNPVNFVSMDWNLNPSTYSKTSGIGQYWIMNSWITKYNTGSKALESRDFGGIFSSARYGYNNSKVITTAALANYYENAFSGAEDEIVSSGITAGGRILKGSGTVTNTEYHTGAYSLILDNGKTGFEMNVPTNNLTVGRNYMASVWIKAQNASNSNAYLYYRVGSVEKGVSGLSGHSNKISGDWRLITLPVKGSDIVAGTTLEVGVRNSGSVIYADDFRFFPVGSVSTAYVYNHNDGLLDYVLNGLNLYTKYEYDAMGQLKAVYREQFGYNPYKVSDFQMHYGKNN
ncbi:Uncharacterised protein [Sphingobacterium spiritivorum]|uniref:Uncharacterized protein n=2 Tax=Sphingobacterium spiritivorum TaxID=258 RepID=A0A380CP53_SPHSI|nr:Uncharacterised protein [Sphingobacterium spiritivorum]